MTEVILDQNGRASARLPDTLLTLVLALAFAALLPATIAFPPSSPFEWVVVALVATTSLLCLLVAGRHYLGREQLLLDGERLLATTRVGPFRRGICIHLKDVQAVEVPALGQEFRLHSWGLGRPSVLIKTSRGTLACCVGVAPREAESIAERIRQALMQEGAVEQLDAADEDRASSAVWRGPRS